MKTNRTITLLGAAVAAVLFAVSVRAQTVLVDFGNDNSFRGVSVPSPDANGNYWNSVVPGLPSTDLVDITNTATTIDLLFSTAVGTDSFNGPAGATTFPDPTAAEIAATDIDTAALGNLGVKEAAIDFAASPGGADNRVRFELQGLDPTLLYTLTFFGSHKFSNDDATVYSVYTDNTYTTLVDSVSLNVQVPGSPHLHNRDSVGVLDKLAPQTGDTLYIQFVGSNGDLGYLNAVQVVGVPEPSSFLLLLGSGLGLLLLLKRRPG